MILNILQKSKETKLLVGFNFYGAEIDFYCGYVLDYNETFVIIQHFTKFGMNDGIIVHQIADVKYFETETDYINNIQYLIDNPSGIVTQTLKLNKKNYSNSFHSLLEQFIGNKDYLVKFELNDDDVYFGLVEWCEDESFSIKIIDSEGMIIGKAIFKLEDLKSYWVDDLECRKRMILYKRFYNVS